MPRLEDGSHTDRQYYVTPGGIHDNWWIVENGSDPFNVIAGCGEEEHANRLCELINGFGLEPGRFFDK